MSRDSQPSWGSTWPSSAERGSTGAGKRTVSTLARIIVAFVVAVALLSVWARVATAGDYYVYSCSSYGNTAPAFSPYSNADHLSTADECMQPAPGGGYRSLEINNPPNAPGLHAYGANWTATTPSPAIGIVGAYTPINTVFVDCNLNSDGFTLSTSGTAARSRSTTSTTATQPTAMGTATESTSRLLRRAISAGGGVLACIELLELERHRCRPWGAGRPADRAGEQRSIGRRR
jgi:hypothetical protein